MNTQPAPDGGTAQEQHRTKERKVVQVGPDRVTITGEEVIIEARREMPDWKVRSSNVITIYFGENKYYLFQKREASRPYSVCYILRPWREDMAANPKRFHTYDDEAVAERDAAVRSEKLHEVVGLCLLPFYPFLGLLWSGVQDWLTRFGIVPRSITGVSIFTVFSVFFGEGVFAVVLINATARSGKMMLGGMIQAITSADHIQIGPVRIPTVLLDCLLLLACLADVLVRYTRYLREYDWHGGFLEWIVPRFSRKK